MGTVHHNHTGHDNIRNDTPPHPIPDKPQEGPNLEPKRCVQTRPEEGPKKQPDLRAWSERCSKRCSKRESIADDDTIRQTHARARRRSQTTTTPALRSNTRQPSSLLPRRPPRALSTGQDFSRRDLPLSSPRLPPPGSRSASGGTPYRALTFVAIFGVAFPLKGGLTARLTPPHAAVPKKRTVLSMDDVACKRKADHHQGCDRFNKGRRNETSGSRWVVDKRRPYFRERTALLQSKNEKTYVRTRLLKKDGCMCRCRGSRAGRRRVSRCV